MKTTILLIFLLMTSNVVSQSISEKFINAIVNHDDNIKEYVDAGELTRSERLGINYNGVKNKFLISFDIDEQVKNDLKEGRLKYEIKEKQLEDNFLEAEFIVPSLNYVKHFYFRDDKYISPSTYFTRNWQTKESKYFIFKISEPKYFNDYCIKKLDEFVDKIADTLEFSSEEKALLEKEKLYYIFCKDEDEVQALTGYKSKGQAVLAFDEVITAYQTHYHELAHLLINFKMKTLGLYTLPFFMEGFAVAMGGRGGMAPRVVTDVGYYLQKTGFLTYDSILTYDNFMSQDANMTYAVAGLYNTFLINSLGAKNYLVLYKKMNGDIEYVKKIKPDEINLSQNKLFDIFLNLYIKKPVVFFPKTEQKYSCTIIKNNGGICEKDSSFYCYLSEKIVLNNKNELKDSSYSSRKFLEVFGGSYSNDNQYLIKAERNGIKIYNLYNDEMIFSFDNNFSIKQIKIYNSDFFISFIFSKNLLDKEFKYKGFMVSGR